MKYYIFFTYSVKKIGGCQLYLRTKKDFLKRNGWNVIVFYCQNGECLINDLLEDSYFIDELSKPSYLYFRFVKNKILNRIAACLPALKKEDTICIESHATYLSTWAEHMAKITKAKHFVYNVDEKPICPITMSDFYRFKLKRREFAGILPDSSFSFLKSGNICVSIENVPSIPAYGAGECIVDVEHNLSFNSDLYTIGLVGRLEKEYMRLTSSQIIDFLNKHNDNRFNLLYIGGEIGGSTIKDQIISNFKNIRNVNLIFTGFLFPIPKTLIEKLDVCISGAGAALAVAQEGITTITIDPRDLRANGVLGVTTTSVVFSNGNKLEISELLERVYNSPQEYYYIAPRNAHKFEEHLEFVNKSDQSKFYNTSFDNILSLRTLLVRIVLTFFKPSRINTIKTFFNE